VRSGGVEMRPLPARRDPHKRQQIGRVADRRKARKPASLQALPRSAEQHEQRRSYCAQFALSAAERPCVVRRASAVLADRGRVGEPRGGVRVVRGQVDRRVLGAVVQGSFSSSRCESAGRLRRRLGGERISAWVLDRARAEADSCDGHHLRCLDAGGLSPRGRLVRKEVR